MNINEPIRGKGFALPFSGNKSTEADLRLPLVKRLPDHVRNHFIAMCGEFTGTVLFLLFALSGTQVANNIPSTTVAGGDTVSPATAGSNPAQLQYIALSFGFSLAVNAWVFFRISGGLFNPAVTFGMCLVGALPWIRGALLIFVQILGGIAASAIVSVLFPGSLNVRTELGGGTTVVQGLFIEMFLTAELVFTIFMLAAEKHKGTFIAPVGIGLSLFIAELTGVYFTGGSVNPARSFGPCVVSRSFHPYHWIYWVGPILGTFLAASFYKLIKILEYETANPGQEDETRTEDLTTLTSRNGAAGGGGMEMGQYISPISAPPTVNLEVDDAVTQRSRFASGSPGMASNDEAFAGLAPGGMHTEETAGRVGADGVSSSSRYRPTIRM
ncbi:MAG: hypothetical protein M1827_001268 [Pycnora praestabilis]|nr:MAG: hypothetical protein M1827_001268 [Pycnora praestabilis]